MLIDIGVNLTNRQFDSDRDQVIHRALSAGVGHMVVTGTSAETSEAALSLAKRYPGILSATAGVHPHDATTFDSKTSVNQLRRLASDALVVAIGECGLDHNRDFSPREAQEVAFDAQLALATELELPIFMHQRDAHDPFLEILRPYATQLKRGVVHCFTGTQAEVIDYLDLDLYIGVTGWICDERRGASLREAVKHIPLNRILVETDAPYLVPRDLVPKPKSRRNEPSYLPHIVSVIAECMGVTPEDLGQHAAANARIFFGLDPILKRDFE